MQLRSLNFAVAALALAAFIPAQSWAEVGDAGDLPAIAQVPAGNGPLNSISGDLNPSPDADMYKIYIRDPNAFSATTRLNPGTRTDTQLFLFDANGFGVTHDDDDPAGGTLLSAISGQFVPAPGNYYIAISGYNLDPVDGAAALIWANSPFNVERQPDGPGAANAIAAWTSGGGSGTYQIDFTGAEYTDPAECFLMVGLNRWNFVLGNDPVLVEPIMVIPMTLTALPVLNVPANNGFTGISLYTQALLFNPAMFPSDPMRVSPAIKFTIGVETVPYGAGSGLSLWNIGSPIVEPGGQIRVNFSID